VEDLNKFREWQRQEVGRNVSIEIGGPCDPNEIKIWCYNFRLEVGQHVQSVDEIDLEAEKEREERRQYEALKAKFEGEGGGINATLP